EQGHAAAQYNMGILYARGDGVGQDMAEAAQWFRRAADGGHPDAQYTLGMTYATGPRRNIVEALSWWRKAAVQGHIDAQYNLGVAYLKGDGVVMDVAESRKWLGMAAGQGYVPAARLLKEIEKR